MSQFVVKRAGPLVGELRVPGDKSISHRSVILAGLAEGESVIDGFLDTITYALQKGDRIELRGYGSFKTVLRKARIVRNTKTGETMELPTNIDPDFKDSKDLRKFVKKKDSEESE